MKIIKRTLKYIGYFLLSFIVFILLYLSVGWGLSKITVNKKPTDSKDITIYIKSNGVHTDLVVPVKNEYFDWAKEIKYSNTLLTDSNMQYIGMGWGNKGFYLETPNWSDLKFSVAFKAAFGLSSTAIHATFFKKLNENDKCKKIKISRENYRRLISYISSSFKKNEAGHFINIKTKANYGKVDAFYEANGSYSLFYTCNSWANSGLKNCGQRACLWTAFDFSIFDKYQ